MTAHDEPAPVAGATIAEQLTALRDDTAARLPGGVGAVFAAESSALNAAGVPEGVAPPGAPMPDGELLGVRGEPATLERVRDGRPAVVVFYRGAWCPHCSLTLRAYEQQLMPELTRRGVALVAVSPQKPDGSLTMRETNELTYSVLSDPGNRVAAQLGILAVPSESVREAQGALGLDVTEHNAEGAPAVPMPTVVLVDEGGTIRWIDVHPDYTTRSEPEAVLRAVTDFLR